VVDVGRNHTAENCKLDWSIVEGKRSPQENNPAGHRQQKKSRMIYREDEGEDQFFHMIQHHKKSIISAGSNLFNGFGILDSGATSHLAPESFEYFKNVTNLETPIVVSSTNAQMTVTKKGDLGLLRNVLMSSGTRELLISVPKLSSDGYRTAFDQWGAHVMKSEVCLFSATLLNGLYLVKLEDLNIFREKAFLLASHQLEATLSNHHRRLAHCGPNLIQRSISHERVAGLAPPLDSSLTICESCLKGKAHRMKDRKDLRAMIPNRLRHPKVFGEVVTGDVTGPFLTPSHLRGSKYLLAFMDAVSGYIWDFYMDSVTAQRSLEAMKEVNAFIQSNEGKFKHFHTDGGRNLISQTHREYFDSQGITWSFSSPYTPEDNGLVERTFATIKNRALAQLVASGLPSSFWEWSVEYTIYITNRIQRLVL
jgi:transposase InsO family protein